MLLNKQAFHAVWLGRLFYTFYKTGNIFNVLMTSPWLLDWSAYNRKYIVKYFSTQKKYTHTFRFLKVIIKAKLCIENFFDNWVDFFRNWQNAIISVSYIQNKTCHYNKIKILNYFKPKRVFFLQLSWLSWPSRILILKTCSTTFKSNVE